MRHVDPDVNEVVDIVVIPNGTAGRADESHWRQDCRTSRRNQASKSRRLEEIRLTTVTNDQFRAETSTKDGAEGLTSPFQTRCSGPKLWQTPTAPRQPYAQEKSSPRHHVFLHGGRDVSEADCLADVRLSASVASTMPAGFPPRFIDSSLTGGDFQICSRVHAATPKIGAQRTGRRVGFALRIFFTRTWASVIPRSIIGMSGGADHKRKVTKDAACQKHSERYTRFDLATTGKE